MTSRKKQYQPRGDPLLLLEDDIRKIPFAPDRKRTDLVALATLNKNPRVSELTKADLARSQQFSPQKDRKKNGRSSSAGADDNDVLRLKAETLSSVTGWSYVESVARVRHDYKVRRRHRDDGGANGGGASTTMTTTPRDLKVLYGAASDAPSLSHPYKNEKRGQIQPPSFGHRPGSASRLFHPASVDEGGVAAGTARSRATTKGSVTTAGIMSPDLLKRLLRVGRNNRGRSPDPGEKDDCSDESFDRGEEEADLKDDVGNMDKTDEDNNQHQHECDPCPFPEANGVPGGKINLGIFLEPTTIWKGIDDQLYVVPVSDENDCWDNNISAELKSDAIHRQNINNAMAALSVNTPPVRPQSQKPQKSAPPPLAVATPPPPLLPRHRRSCPPQMTHDVSPPEWQRVLNQRYARHRRATTNGNRCHCRDDDVVIDEILRAEDERLKKLDEKVLSHRVRGQEERVKLMQERKRIERS
mmetsp:Transcript_33724/g.41345  ORF Transcript_33724/g.41345 Transcript_33724/m.41345 type:complete len:471 (+) Transcript_33724:78-1490(+)